MPNRFKNGPLFLFDEPTTGLHFDDINKLLRAFRKLVDAGNTVLIVEHNMDVIKTADWVIDLGPEGRKSRGPSCRSRHARKSNEESTVLYRTVPGRLSRPDQKTARRTAARYVILLWEHRCFRGCSLFGTHRRHTNTAVGSNAGWVFLVLVALCLPAQGAPLQRPGSPARSPSPSGVNPQAGTEEAQVTDLLRKAEEAMKGENCATAAVALETVLLLESDHLGAIFNLAYCYTQLGRKPEAIERYSNVLALNSKLFPAHLNLGLLLADTGQLEDAVGHLAQAVDIKGDHVARSPSLCPYLELGGT